MTGENEKKLDDKLFEFLEYIGIKNPRETHYCEVVDISADIQDILENDLIAKETIIEDLNTTIDTLTDEVGDVKENAIKIKANADTALNDVIESLDSVIDDLKNNYDVLDKIKAIKANAELDKKELSSLYF